MSGILVAGIGNIFLADDGFGVEVARRLGAEPLPAAVEVRDYGIRGAHLAYQLLRGYDVLILFDALSRRQAPGTLYVLEPARDAPAPPLSDAHAMDPATVLAIVKTLGGELKRVMLVGCEPAELVERIGLSAPVAAAGERAVGVVRDLIEQTIANPCVTGDS